MPTKIVNDLIDRVKSLETKLNDHLIESGKIQTWLTVNTWLTGLILAGLIGQLWYVVFHK